MLSSPPAAMAATAPNRNSFRINPPGSLSILSIRYIRIIRKIGGKSAANKIIVIDKILSILLRNSRIPDICERLNAGYHTAQAPEYRFFSSGVHTETLRSVILPLYTIFLPFNSRNSAVRRFPAIHRRSVIPAVRQFLATNSRKFRDKLAQIWYIRFCNCIRQFGTILGSQTPFFSAQKRRMKC